MFPIRATLVRNVSVFKEVESIYVTLKQFCDIDEGTTFRNITIAPVPITPTGDMPIQDQRFISCSMDLSVSRTRSVWVEQEKPNEIYEARKILLLIR